MIEAIGVILGLLAIWLLLCDIRNEFAGPLLLAGGVLLVIAGMALAHDHGRADLDPWYKDLKSGKGPCCDGSDYKPMADVDWETRDGRYRVRIDGQWVDVPPEAVLPGPNRDGRTLVWPSWGDGKRTVRCFMPGAMT